MLDPTADDRTPLAVAIEAHAAARIEVEQARFGLVTRLPRDWQPLADRLHDAMQSEHARKLDVLVAAGDAIMPVTPGRLSLDALRLLVDATPPDALPALVERLSRVARAEVQDAADEAQNRRSWPLVAFLGACVFALAVVAVLDWLPAAHYLAIVLDDGDYLNDMLTHLPEWGEPYIRQTGRWLAFATRSCPPC